MSNKYLKLAELPTQYAKRMNFLSNRIFNEVSRPTNKTSMRVVKLFEKKPLQKTKYFVNWYPRHWETGYMIMKLRKYGLFRDEHLDFKDEMNRLRALRGKAPPVKELKPGKSPKNRI
ncbi:small ribosomal subunit protein mS33 [Culicoides brevitarsis]|uniref:small ribosomal subunit protein mS33 n=1 Tax=Culicoides brevitarsis TaxID=469753 RepID=UPI00307BC5B7